MFREMRRFKQQISQEECIEILKTEPRGILSMLGDDGYPYGIPLNHWYCEEDGHIYFHGARAGHKIDAVQRCDKVSYCVYDQGTRLCRKFTDDEMYLQKELKTSFSRVQCLELIPEHMTGKLVNES